MTQDSMEPKSVRGRDGNGEPSSVADKTHEAAEYVRDAALSRVQAARSSADSAKEKAAERVRSLGATVRKVGEQLRAEDQTYAADKASDFSHTLDDVAAYVSSAELGTLVRDGENAAREKPLLFFGSAFVLGLAAGRFLKVAGGAVTGSQSQRSPRPARLPGGNMHEPVAPTASAGLAGSSQPLLDESPYATATRRTPTERGVGQ